MISLAKWVIVLLVVVLIGLMLWSGGFIGPKTTPEIQVAQDEIECVAAAALADSKREPGANLDSVRQKIAKAVRRYSSVNKTPVCDVFEKGLTMIPVGHKRTGVYLGRRRGYVQFEFTKAAWNTSMVMAKQVLLLPEAALGCATHYIRAERTYREPPDVTSKIEAQTLVPNDPTDKSMIRFYCQK